MTNVLPNLAFSTVSVALGCTKVKLSENQLQTAFHRKIAQERPWFRLGMDRASLLQAVLEKGALHLKEDLC
jgi:hypothetical protein